VVALSLSAAEKGVFRDHISLVWDYRTNNLPETVVRIYGSSDLTVPMKAWPIITMVTGETHVTFNTVPDHWFFAVTASNWWGESSFSNVLEIPEPPSSDIKLWLE